MSVWTDPNNFTQAREKYQVYCHVRLRLKWTSGVGLTSVVLPLFFCPFVCCISTAWTTQSRNVGKEEEQKLCFIYEEMITGTFSKSYFQWRFYRINTNPLLPNPQDHVRTLLFLHFSFSLSSLTYVIYIFFSLALLWANCCLLCLTCPPFLIYPAKPCDSSQPQLQYDFSHPLLCLNSIYQVSSGTKSGVDAGSGPESLQLNEISQQLQTV